MQAYQFDELSKELGGTSRRGLLRVLVGAAAAGGLGGLFGRRAQSVAADPPCRDNGGKCKAHHECCYGYACLNGTCACPAGSAPNSSGVCICSATGYPPCNGACCGAGASCLNGVCSSVCCAGGLTVCGGACVNTSSDAHNCGSCGNACASGQTCTNGACVGTTACSPGATRPCYTGPAGTQGVGACRAGTQSCLPNGTWSTMCTGQVLPQPEVCGNGQDDDCDGQVDNGCSTCSGGQTQCPGGCADLSSDANNCGVCGHVCSFPNATGACVSGQCKLLTCNQGFGDCNSNPADGCETQVNTNANCGACGHTCGVCQTCTTNGGISTCAPLAAGTACGACGVCDGAGACTAVGAGTPCGTSGFACDGSTTTCPATCGSDTNCAGGFFCSGSACVRKLPTGGACSRATQCQNNCCNSSICC